MSNGYATLNADGRVPMAQLAAGTPDGTKFIRDDGTLVTPPSGGSPPTGTGFRHVTAGVEDVASKLVDTADVNDAQITLAKLANITGPTVLGRVSGAGVPIELTAAQRTEIIDAFTSALKGLVPASGGGTTNFLRADGTWTAPPGGPPSGAAGGDLSGTYPDPKVVRARTLYSPGSFTLETETAAIYSRHIKFTTTQRATLQGTATLRIT